MATASLLPSAGAAVDQVVAGLESPGAFFALTGPPTAGKSTALREIRSRIDNRTAFFLAPPAWADDGPFVAMASLAAQLDDGKLRERIRDIAVPWRDKQKTIVAAVRDRADSSVLLFDEPHLEGSLGPHPSIFERRAHELTQALLSIPGLRKVVTVRAHELSPPTSTGIEVRRSTNVDAVLARERWNGFGDAASTLREVGGDRLAVLSPLELRLAVALTHFGGDPRIIARGGMRAGVLVERLFAHLAASQALRKVIGRLAVVRTPFDERMLTLAGAPALDRDARHVLEQVLLFGAEDQRVLHELLRREASDRAWLTSSELDDAHRTAAKWHREELERRLQSTNVEAVVRHELDTVHHLTMAGDADAVDALKPWFVEQYDALGRVLSLRREYRRAISCYERALEHDEEDAYAHHYLAFNLDALAEDAERVEKEYLEGLRWESRHVWYHNRLICFLVVRGRMNDARERWNIALEDLEYARTDERLYRELHRPIAHLALHRGQLDFAAMVLEDVPVSVQSTLFDSLRRLLAMLREAEANETVFPPHIAIDERWKGPHLVRDSRDLPRVEKWIPARLVSVTPEELHFRCARRDGAQVALYYRDISSGEMKRKSGYFGRGLGVPAGSFVEFVTIKGRERILLHDRRRPELDLMPIELPPDRYLRRVRASSH